MMIYCFVSIAVVMQYADSLQGSYWQVSVKFKDFSRTSKRLSYSFSRTKVYEKTDLSVKFYFRYARLR